MAELRMLNVEGGKGGHSAFGLSIFVEVDSVSCAVVGRRLGARP